MSAEPAGDALHGGLEWAKAQLTAPPRQRMHGEGPAVVVPAEVTTAILSALVDGLARMEAALAERPAQGHAVQQQQSDPAALEALVAGLGRIDAVAEALGRIEALLETRAIRGPEGPQGPRGPEGPAGKDLL
jgi:hypothetical protein